MKYEIAERFKSIQGEGVYAGTPMAFLRFVGCSVGKKICNACDTDFERTLPWRGGGTFTPRDLWLWGAPYRHACLTGGEPLDQDLQPLFEDNEQFEMFHIETSGTKPLPPWTRNNGFNNDFKQDVWICVSPKPGFIEDVVLAADEVKVIVPGLGSNESLPFKTLNTGTGSTNERLRWPDLSDALRWADAGKVVFLQPRNSKLDVDWNNLRLVQDILVDHPNLRLSLQLHKLLKVQ